MDRNTKFPLQIHREGVDDQKTVIEQVRARLSETDRYEGGCYDNPFYGHRLACEDLRRLLKMCEGLHEHPNDPGLVMRDGRVYEETAPGVFLHRRNLEDTDDTNI